MLKNKRKLLILSPIFPPQTGGPATYAENIADNLKDFFDITVISSYKINSDKPDTEYPFRHISFKSKAFVRSFLFLFYSLKHIFSCHTVFITCSIQDTFLCMLAASVLRKKTLFRIGGEYHREFLSNKNNPGISDRIKSIITLILLKLSTIFISQYICVSEVIKDYLRSIGIREKITILQNPAPVINNRKKISHITDKNHIRLLTAGRLICRKRFDSLIKLTAYNKDFLLTLGGDGPEGDDLRKLAEKHNVSHRIVFKGNLNRNELLSEFEKNHFFILNSESGEGSPNIILEALEYGIPVLGSKHIEMTGVLDNENGFIYSDPEQAFDFMKKNLDKEKYSILAQKSHPKKENSKKHHIKKLTRLLT
ncbi:MAG: glycosyltransferase family 4 protein [Candidatus Muiribacteriaceae bacterium]